MTDEHVSTGGAAIAHMTLCTDDGCPVAATRFRARGERRGVILVAPATGVRRRYYAPFAEYFAALGWDVLTWDWRGVADSRFGLDAADPRLTMSNWGAGDLSAAIAWADRRAMGDPVVLVGHSFGGQAVALAGNATRLDAIVLIAAQHGWLGNWPLLWRLPLWLFWSLVVPLVTRLLGHFPSRRFGLGETLPAGVALEWARWCRRREYHGEWNSLSEVRAPVLAWSAADDLIAPRAAVDRLLSEFRGSARVVHRHLTPESMGLPSIGHFGFFRDGVVPALWQDSADFLDAVAAHPPLGTPVS